MANNKIYISNLSKTVSEDDLKQHFNEYGEISEIHLPRDKKTKEPKGYAFVTFAYEDSAQRSLEQDSTNYQDQEITVQIAVEKRAKK